MIDSISEDGGAPDLRRSRRRHMPGIDPAKLDRLPPQSTEGEQGVLGCCLWSPNECIPECLAKFKGSDCFYDLRHQTIYNTIQDMYDERIAVDLILLQQRLKDAQMLDQVGGIAYLSSLQDAVPSAANLSYYLDIMMEKAVLRMMIRTCSDIVGRAYEFEGEVDQLMDEAERDILRIAGARVNEVDKSAKELVKRAISQVEAFHENQGQLNGVATGFHDFDKMTMGLQAGEMIVIAARPSMGKTSLAMNIAEHVVLESKLPVGVFSLEMKAEALMLRMLCSRARVNIRNVREGFLAERDFPKLTAAAGKLAAAPIYIDDSAGLSILQLRAKARRMHQEHGVKLIIIDYLQMLHSTAARAKENRQQEVADISSGIKELAKELDIPVVVLAQLNRELEKDKTRKPRLSDLRESGCLSADTRIYCRSHISPISELNIDADGRGELFSVGMKNKSEIAHATKAWKTGKKQVLELVLSTGHKILATGDHKFLGIGNKWIPLANLSVGDPIAIALNANPESEPTVSLAEARLLGLFVSNGCTLPRRSTQITFNDEDRDLAAIAIADAAKVFKGELRPHLVKTEPSTRAGHRWINVFFPSKRVPSKIRKSDMTVWLMKHGLWGCRAKEKRIPPELFNQPKPIVREFLAAIFSGDGTCGIFLKGRKGSIKKKRQYVVACYSSSSRELIDGIQWLLQRLGIVSGITKTSCRGFVIYCLQVYSRCSKVKFANEIGFLSRRKDKTMRRVVSAMLEAPQGYEKYIPDGDVAFVPIKSITACGTQEVWDATVAKTHNFVANGIVAHNCIEQDADLVGLLYKPYAKDEQEGEESDSTTHFVNLLIAKQRNGPTGDVALTFLKDITRFESAAKVSEQDLPI